MGKFEAFEKIPPWRALRDWSPPAGLTSPIKEEPMTSPDTDQLPNDNRGVDTAISVAVHSKPASYAGYTSSGGPNGPTDGIIHLVVGGPVIDDQLASLIERAKIVGLSILVDPKEFSYAALQSMLVKAWARAAALLPADSPVAGGIDAEANRAVLFITHTVPETTFDAIRQVAADEFGTAVLVERGEHGRVDDWS
jgi:hypothetical protein